VIFVDDGSTDGSAGSFSALMPQAKVIEQANAGVAAARNTGANVATGEFIQFLDADDIILPGKLHSQARSAAERGLDVVYSDWQMVIVDAGHERREPICDTPMPFEPVASLLDGWWVPPHAYLFRRSAYWAVGGGDDTLVNAQDFDLVVRMAIAGSRFGHLPGHYADYYRYLSATSLARGPRRRYWADYERAVERAVSLLEAGGGFDAARRLAAANKLHSVARSAYSIDRQWFERVLARIEEIAPDFVPSGTIGYRAVSYVLGMRAAERVAAAVRALRTRTA
jgi:glycosyltransferase involved in cell wall biosynthesis